MGNFTKRIIIIVLCITAIMDFAGKGFAQSAGSSIPDRYDSNTATRFGIYIEGGITIPYTDVKSPKHISYITGIQVSYNPFPFIGLAGSMRIGQLKAGDKGSIMNDNMYFENRIFDAVFIVQLFPLKLADVNDNIVLSYLSSFYIGGGMGMIKSHVDAHRFYPSDFEYIGNYTGRNVVFQIIAGFDIPVIRFSDNRTVNIIISYRVNFCHTDKLDGYVTPEYQNGKNDAYNDLNVGIGYRF